MTGRQTRAESAAHPLARDSISKIAELLGGCLQPVQLRRTDTATGEVTQVLIPCGATLASICPPCAERAKALRAAQCREGWHLEDEPDLSPAAPDETQEYWLTLRAEAQAYRDRAQTEGNPSLSWTNSSPSSTPRSPGWVSAVPSPPPGPVTGRRRAADPATPGAARTPPQQGHPRTVGRVFTAKDGKSYRPSNLAALSFANGSAQIIHSRVPGGQKATAEMRRTAVRRVFFLAFSISGSGQSMNQYRTATASADDLRQIRTFTTSAIVDKYAVLLDHANDGISIRRRGATG